MPDLICFALRFTKTCTCTNQKTDNDRSPIHKHGTCWRTFATGELSICNGFTALKRAESAVKPTSTEVHLKS